MGKDDYERREAQRKADEAKHHAANEVHRKAMDNKAAFEAQERKKNTEAWERAGKASQKLQRESGGKSGSGTGPCFVATAAFGDYNAPEVVFLRTFRDELLSQSFLGRCFIRAYYRLSPPIAAVIAKSQSLRTITRKFCLQPTISLLRRLRRE